MCLVIHFVNLLNHRKEAKLTRKFLYMQKNRPSHKQPVRPLESAHVIEQ